MDFGDRLFVVSDRLLAFNIVFKKEFWGSLGNDKYDIFVILVGNSTTLLWNMNSR